MLTSYHSWSDNDGDEWNVEDFINKILKWSFVNPDWIDEVTAWWTK